MQDSHGARTVDGVVVGVANDIKGNPHRKVFSRTLLVASLAVFAALCGAFPTGARVTAARAASLGACAGAAQAINTGGGACNSGPVQLSAREQALLALKQKLAAEYFAARAGTFSYAQYQRDSQAFLALYGGPTTTRGGITTPLCIVNPDTGQCAPSSASVGLTQQPQANYYYCGPATASEVLGVRGVNVSQGTLAGNNYLKTNANGGTNWGPPVMAPTLNTLTNSSYYLTVNGSGVGGGFSQSDWENDLVFDVDNGWAIAGNIVEYANQSPHLVGHPSNLTIYHWIAVYGYTSYGGNTRYADSISGDSWIWSWAANVPPYSLYSSASMTTLLNQRGFVW